MWAGLDSNQGPTDYESAALTAELPARIAWKPRYGGVFLFVSVAAHADGDTFGDTFPTPVPTHEGTVRRAVKRIKAVPAARRFVHRLPPSDPRQLATVDPLGRSVPEDVACPACGAQPDERCQSAGGRPADAHPERVAPWSRWQADSGRYPRWKARPQSRNTPGRRQKRQRQVAPVEVHFKCPLCGGPHRRGDCDQGRAPGRRSAP
jgi:hypothetical protein